MTLTIGRAPFARPPGGDYNFDYLGASPKHTLFLHDVPKRVRGVLAGETVVDTRRAKMLHESNLFPQWYVPEEDVQRDLLEPTNHTTHCPFKGDATYWTVRVRDRVEDNVVWSYPEPKDESKWLRGLVAFYFDRLDAWYEEDEQIFGHPRDPYHRFDCRRTSEHVEVAVGGEIVAETRRAVKLFETGLPPRYYLPFGDVHDEALEKTDTSLYCPYKGGATYWDVTGGGTRVEDGAWALPEPLGEAVAVLDHVSFLGDGIDVTADDRPVLQ